MKELKNLLQLLKLPPLDFFKLKKPLKKLLPLMKPPLKKVNM